MWTEQIQNELSFVYRSRLYREDDVQNNLSRRIYSKAIDEESSLRIQVYGER